MLHWVSHPAWTLLSYDTSDAMITNRVNPYDAPRIVESTRVRDAESGPTRLSNRVMASVVGLPATLFLIVGFAFWAEMLLRVTIPTGKETAFMWVIVIAGVLLPALGLAMMGVSIFLWRYSDTQAADD